MRHVKEHLAKHLLREAQENGACVLPRVLAYDDLIQDIADQQVLEARLDLCRPLHPTAEVWLWESIIREDFAQSGSDNPFTAFSSLAREARRAFRLALDYQLPLDQHAAQFELHEESSRVLGWFRAFEERMHRLARLNGTQLQSLLLGLREGEAQSQLALIPEQGVCAVGFQMMTPLQEQVLQSFAGAQLATAELTSNVAHSAESAAHSTRTMRVEEFPDLGTELAAAANWLCASHQSNPSGRYAVVVPQLAQQRPQVERIFNAAFAETLASTEGDVLNLSSGIPLSRTTLVRHWLLLLKSINAPINRLDTLELVQSPYFLPGALSAKVDLQAALIATQQDELKLGDWLRALDWHQNKAQPSHTDDNFLTALAALGDSVRRLREQERKTMPEWLELIETWVSTLGWPMQESHDSDEFQQFRMFRTCCQQLAEHGDLFGEISLAAAIGLCERFFAQTDYQRQTIKPDNTEIAEVLGVLEASGQCFDGLWLCQMGDREWPIPSQLNPLIPYGLQQDYGMPGASEREFAFWQGIIRQLIDGANELCASYAEAIDEVSQRLSAYLDGLSGVSAIACDKGVRQNSSKTLASAGERAAARSLSIEVLEDHCGVPLESDERLLIDTENGVRQIRKGLGILRDYAVLPLQAYLKHRLGLERLLPVSQTLTPAERGMAVHSTLEHFWRKHLHQQSLAALSEEAVGASLRETLISQLEQLNRRRFKPLKPSDVALEATALARILSGFLRIERERHAFSVIASELDVRYRYGNFELLGRIDRVDLTEGGGLQLIDYKTGQASTKGWFDEEVSEPQLPLYALALGEDENFRSLQLACAERLGDAAFIEGESVASIAFANLSVGAVGLDGCSDEAFEVLAQHGVKVLEKTSSSASDWSEQLALWRTAVNQSFAAMLEGDAHMLARAPAENSSYQALLRSGFPYTIRLDEHQVEWSGSTGTVSAAASAAGDAAND